MTFYEILDILNSTTSRNKKIELVQHFLETEPLFYKVCKLALDPLINFGFKSIPQYDHENCILSFGQGLAEIETLINTHYSNDTIGKLIDILSHCEPEDADVLEKIVLKDLRCGVQVATVNKAIDNINKTREHKLEKIFDYPCMLTSAYSEKLINKLLDNNDYLICQQKCDGMRFNAVIDENRNVTLFGRSGKQININDERFYQLFEQFPAGYVVDGELLIDGKQDGTAVDRKIGNGILNKAVRGTISIEESKRVTAVLWDIIPLNSFKKGIDNSAYEARFNKLKARLSTIETDDRLFLVQTEIVNSLEQINEMFNLMISQGKEGVIVKSPRAVWKNVRSTECVKLKAELDIDARCIGKELATGRFEGMLGALICETDDHKVQFKVGTGFTEQQRIDLNTDDIIGKIITVRYNGRIKDKNRPDVDSLFLPRFIEVRYDKDVTNSSEDVK